MDKQLDSLPGAKLTSVTYDPLRVCLSGTRTELLKDIEQWIDFGDTSERILWLSGAAGTGKSSVANSIAKKMGSLARLGASFRFDRSQADRTPTTFIGNLCRQVAGFNDSLKKSIHSAFTQHGGSGTCAFQAEKLFVEPILKAKHFGQIVIVIDALDESNDDEFVTGGTSREDLIRIIVEQFPRLPPTVKLLMTSREEDYITNRMSKCPCKHLRIAETPGIEADIQAFIEDEMSQIRESKRGPDWPGADKINALKEYADNLFICAAVTCTRRDAILICK